MKGHGHRCMLTAMVLFVEYDMTLPDYTAYTDVISKSQIPHIPASSLASYLQSNNKNFDEKCRLLYAQRYLRYARVAQWNNMSYIKSSVWAEMKKHTSYNVDVCLDKHGIVQEAQCECGAGQGPSAHCKHVITVIFGLQKLCSNKILLTEQTCTQVLQTFHQAKPYTGAPMSTDDLHDLRKHHYIYDPRPPAASTTYQSLGISGILSKHCFRFSKCGTNASYTVIHAGKSICAN